MELNYYTKYKDRSPVETVSILKKFFLDRGFDLKLTSNINSECGSWSCRWELYYHNRFIIGQNGKGVNEIFSFASGLAELYERFCNISILWAHNPIWYDLIKPDGKRLTVSECLDSLPYLRTFYESWVGENVEDFINVLTNGLPIGVEYNSLNGLSSIYIDERIINRTNGSFGMCAGNSHEEALIQGICELYEIYCTIKFYDPQIKIKYTLINPALYETNSTLIKMIENIEAKNPGSEVLFLDFSEQFGLPVIAAIYINYEPMNIVVNFGASPYFDIALERSLTEIYQGRYAQDELALLKPLETAEIFDIWAEYPGAVGHSGFLRKSMFDLLIMNNQVNDKVYLHDGLSQVEVLQHLITLGEKQKIKLWTRDMSQCPQMKAYHIIPDFDISVPVQAKPSIKLTGWEYDAIVEQIIQDTNFLYNMIYNQVSIERYQDYLSDLKRKRPVYPLATFGWQNLYGMSDDLIAFTLSLIADNEWWTVKDILPKLKGTYLYQPLIDFFNYNNLESMGGAKYYILYYNQQFDYNIYLDKIIKTEYIKIMPQLVKIIKGES